MAQQTKGFQSKELNNLIRKTFDTYDIDCSGELDPYELEKCLNDICTGLNIPLLTTKQLKWALNTLDENHDGAIQFEEMNQHIGKILDHITFKRHAVILDPKDVEELGPQVTNLSPGQNSYRIDKLGKHIKVLEVLHTKKDRKSRFKDNKTKNPWDKFVPIESLINRKLNDDETIRLNLQTHFSGHSRASKFTKEHKRQSVIDLKETQKDSSHFYSEVDSPVVDDHKKYPLKSKKTEPFALLTDKNIFSRIPNQVIFINNKRMC